MLPIRTCPPLLNVEGLSQASKPESAPRRRRELGSAPSVIPTPSHPPIHRRIRAMAMSDCLQLSTKELHFQMYSSQFNAMKQGIYIDCQEIMLINNSKKKIHWQLDLRNNVTLNDDIFRVLHSSLGPFISSASSAGPEGEIDPKEVFTFKINFVPRTSGVYRTSIPLYINHNHQTPYTYIDLFGELIMPSFIFQPQRLILPPVPLNIESSATVRIKAKGFEKSVQLIFFRSSQLSLLAHRKSVDVDYDFRVEFVDKSAVNGERDEDLTLMIFFSSSHAYSEQIIVEMMDEDRNR
jgi:hypothetical protein